MDWVVELRSPFLTPIFLALTALGDVVFYLLALCLGYWLIDRRRFRLLAAITMAAGLANSLLKGFFQEARPSGIPVLLQEEGFSFPSGHAQLAATFWVWWALEQGKRWGWTLAALMVLGIAASRVYLGVHYPHDVLAGILIGLATVAACWRVGHAPPAWWQNLGGWQALITTPVLALLWYAFPAGIDHVAAIASGSLVGLQLGAARVPEGWPLPRRPLQVAIALIVGLSVTFALRIGLKEPLQALPISEALADALRYFVIALWMTWWAPLIFARPPAGAISANSKA